MTKTIIAISIATILLLGSISFAVPASAVQIWTASGTGTVTVTDPDIDDDGQAQYTYFNRGFSGSSTFQTIATTTGTETLDWEWRFFHAFFNVRAGLNSFDPSGTTVIHNLGPANCCTFPSGGGVLTGQVTFNTVAGQPYGFTITGSNFDRDNRVLGTFTIQKTNEDPVCDNAQPSQSSIWPPNHKMKSISINGITDPDGDAVTVTVDSITQDEPTNGLGDGDKSPDGDGVGTDTAQVRAERSGLEDGRVYEISFTADDGNGGSCSGSVQVGVPHDKKDTAIDSGQTVDSTS